MCNNCNIIKTLFHSAKENPHENYIPVLRFLEGMETEKRIELFAGDSLLRYSLEVLNSEKHFTVCHYLKCPQCGQIHFLGACIRGIPLYKVIDNIDNEKLDNLIWGNVGTKYNN